MNNQASQKLSSVLYLPHGGGPLPVLGDKNHEFLVNFLKEIPRKLGQPSAIVVISAHWEEEQPTITSGKNPQLIYDYYGFPAESYEIQYPAPGDPGLAKQLHSLLGSSGIISRLDDQRGFDHGMFIPLKLMYPQALIPCVQLSLCTNLSPADHIAIGKSIAGLRRENILVIGSGLSFHNMKEFFSSTPDQEYGSLEFNNWLIETCTNTEISSGERERRLIEWEAAPSARFCHPREEHLLPLHVCYGIASADTPVANLVFNDRVLGKPVSGLLW